MIRPYPQYRDSDVEWLGDIPGHWKLRSFRQLLSEPLKYSANEEAKYNSPDHPRFIRITDIDDEGRLRSETFRSLPFEIAEPYMLKPGDLLFARSGSVGRTFLYDHSWGPCAYAGYLIRARVDQTQVLPKHVSYYSGSASYAGWLQTVAIQATIKNVSASRYARMPVPLPPIDEQHAISEFLDHETGKIDAVIEKNRQLIERLEEYRTALITRTVTRGLPPHAAREAGLNHSPRYRDSGIEWLGEIPAEWEVKRLSHIASYRTSSVDKKSVDGELRVRLCNYTDVYYQDRVRATDGEFMNATATKREVEGFRLRRGDVVITKDSEDWRDIGVSALIEESAEDFVCGYHLGIIRPRGLMNPGFLFRLMQSVAVNRQLQVSASGVTRYGLPRAAICEAQVPLPPADEQWAIAAFLDRETERVNVLCSRVETAVERLLDYRTALVTAAVTGKIDVREVAATGIGGDGA